MAFFRVLSRYSHWPNAESDDWDAEALSDLVGDEVSLFRYDTERESRLIAVGFSFLRTAPRHLDSVHIPDSVLQKPELKLEHSPDNCPFPWEFVKQRHWDLYGCTEAIARQIVEQIVSLGHKATRCHKNKIIAWAHEMQRDAWPEVSVDEWAGAPNWLRLPLVDKDAT